MDLDPGWPCRGPLLDLAVDAARRLLPAFDTPTGMPYGTVNLRHGVPKGETPVTCTAGVGTFIVEFASLSRLTGDPVFENTAMRALNSLWGIKSSVGLFGNHVDVESGKWTATEAGIGAGVDSYYEYLVSFKIRTACECSNFEQLPSGTLSSLPLTQNRPYLKIPPHSIF